MLYGHAGQLSIDGATYSADLPANSEPESSPEGASPHLGTLHSVSLRPDQTGAGAPETECRRASSAACGRSWLPLRARCLSTLHAITGGEHSALVDRPIDLPPSDHATDVRRARDELESALRAQLSPTRRAARQLELDVELVDNAPQLSMWRRLEIAHNLTYEAHDPSDPSSKGGRQGKCMWVRRIGADEDIVGKRHESGAYTLHGMVRCGLAVCPHCGGQKARTTTSSLAVAMTRHLAGDARTDETAIGELVGSSSKWRDVAMLTLTPPHRLQDDLREHTTRLYAAVEHFQRSRTWSKFAERLGLVGKVRALDAVHGGPNGSHVHFHTALFLTNATVPSEFVSRFKARQPERERLADEWAEWDAARADWRRARGKTKRRQIETLGRVGYVADGEFTLENASAMRATEAELDAGRAADREYTRSLLDTMAAIVRDVGEDLLPRFMPIEPLRDQPQSLREAWLDELGRELVAAWEYSCRHVGIAIDYPGAFRARALKLSPAEHAWSYFTKWGLADEVGASTAKDRNHLRLLDAVGAGVDGAGDVYLEFARATKGKQWITGLADVCKRYGVTDEDAQAYRAELRRKRDLEREQRGEPVVVIKPLKVLIRPHVLDGALAIGWHNVWAFVDECEARGGDYQAELDVWLFTARLDRAAARPPPLIQSTG